MKIFQSHLVRALETSLLLFLTGLFLLVVFAVVEGPWDPIADWYWASGQNSILLTLAHEISRWGDFWPGGLFLCVVIGIAGILLRSSNLRRAALLAICAALIAGSFSTALKSVLGRARPHVAIQLKISDGFHGPHWTSSFASFPSGHTTTAFAVAVTFSILLRRRKYYFLALAALVGWSRLYVGAHYLGDVLTGAWIGSYTGWLLTTTFLRWRAAQLERQSASVATEPVLSGRC